ncbi:MAG TPA: HAMP domain-containing sensor histidine kinase [Salinimicrobium sp.]|nr:HAMP domain-containing sensor histidine kinase [Salinimicrobium sp.]
MSASATISTEEKLQERIKELSCLYEVSSILTKHEESLQNTLKRIAKVLQQAWRFSDDAIVELKLGDFLILSKKLPENTIFQYCSIKVFNEENGFLKVHYPSAKYSEKYFLPEELKLLKKVSWEIGSFMEREQNKEKEEILKRSAQRNDRLSILGEITAGIAHELNTPLGNILGFAELIAGKTTESQTKSDIKKIIKSSIFSREVVKKLMFFACEMPQNMEFIKIKPIMLQVLSLLGPNFKKAEISYSFKMENSGLKAQLDSIQLSQVLFNILINAIYVSPKNGKIEIEVHNNEENFFIEVKDEGPGIKKEIHSKIFEPFFTTKPLGEGSGLGLSVVHGIVKSHKGEIVAIDNNPKGTIFKIRLPLTM